jgi:hypothetical protein
MIMFLCYLILFYFNFWELETLFFYY